jgi:hypothetical protein
MIARGTSASRDAVAYERQTMMDGLRTELSFLQSRHGIVQGPTALLSSISESTEAVRIMADAKDRDRQSEWSRPDAYAAEIPPRMGVPLVGASAGASREVEADRASGRRIPGILSKGPFRSRESEADLAAAVLRRSAERREGR